VRGNAALMIWPGLAALFQGQDFKAAGATPTSSSGWCRSAFFERCKANAAKVWL
jgi:hypothetical protein